MALCVFLLGLKAYLATWYVFVKRLRPLADAPFDAPLLVIGADLMFCAILAALYLLIRKASRQLPQRIGRVLRNGVPPLIHTIVVIFATSSFMVTRLYGSPLNITHLRTADDLRIIEASLVAYLGALPLGLIVLGIAMYPLGAFLARLIRHSITARTRWRLWSALLGVCTVMFGLWGTRLGGIATFGVKDNAVIYFARHYRPELRPIDARRQILTLASELGDQIDDRAATQSLRLGRTTLSRDFQFDDSADSSSLNVLVIQIESTSAEYVDEKTTPNLLKMAQHGVSFVNHSTVYTESIPATYALYWSDYLGDLGTSPRLLYERRLPQLNLAEVLRSHGYTTGLFHSSFLSWGDFQFLFEDEGFDTIVDSKTMLRPDHPLPWSWGVAEEQTVEALTSWITQHRDQKFFAIYGTMFPHHPYECPLPEDQRPFPHTSWINRYRNSLYYADLNVGRVITFLGEQGLLDRTLVVVVGDHGETVTTYPVGHGLAVTPEEIRPPLIVSNPRLFAAAQQSSLYSSHLDVAPSILGILGITPPAAWLGRELFDESVPAAASHVTIHLSHSTGIIDNGLLAAFGESGSRGRLYDMSAGALTPAADDELNQQLLAQYRERDQVMQKWIRYRHLLRATRPGEFSTIASKPPDPRRLTP